MLNRSSRALPDCDALLADPANFLGHREIAVRAWPRRHAAFLLAVLFWLAFTFGSAATLGRYLPNLGPASATVAALIVVVVASLGSYCLGRFLTRWGSVVISIGGARFVSRRTEVLCPWALFAAPGQPDLRLDSSFALRPQLVAVVLPVASDLVPSVVASRRGFVLAYGMEIKTRHVRFVSPDEIMLMRLGGQVEWKDLARILLDVGRSLTKAQHIGPSAGRVADRPRGHSLVLKCPKCASRDVVRAGKPSLLDGQTGYQCKNCRLRMASLRSRRARLGLMMIAISLAIVTSALFGLLFLVIGGRENQGREIHVIVISWLVSACTCICTGIAELHKPMPIKDAGAGVR